MAEAQRWGWYAVRAEHALQACRVAQLSDRHRDQPARLPRDYLCGQRDTGPAIGRASRKHRGNGEGEAGRHCGHR